MNLRWTLPCVSEKKKGKGQTFSFYAPKIKLEGRGFLSEGSSVHLDLPSDYTLTDMKDGTLGFLGDKVLWALRKNGNIAIIL